MNKDLTTFLCVNYMNFSERISMSICVIFSLTLDSIIYNHAGCGPEAKGQAYHINLANMPTLL